MDLATLRIRGPVLIQAYQEGEDPCHQRDTCRELDFPGEMTVPPTVLHLPVRAVGLEYAGSSIRHSSSSHHINIMKVGAVDAILLIPKVPTMRKERKLNSQVSSTAEGCQLPNLSPASGCTPLKEAVSFHLGMRASRMWWIQWKCPPSAQSFEYLVPSCWNCL